MKLHAKGKHFLIHINKKTEQATIHNCHTRYDKDGNPNSISFDIIDAEIDDHGTLTLIAPKWQYTLVRTGDIFRWIKTDEWTKQTHSHRLTNKSQLKARKWLESYQETN